MNPHTGIRLSVAIAQNGIFLRRFAAATYGGSGLTGGAAGAAGAAPRAAGALDVAATAGVAAPVVAGVVAAVAGVDAASAAGASESPPCPMADRRSRDRLRRCSGISVTGRMIDGNGASSGISGGDTSDRNRCTYAQPGALGRVSCQTSYIR